MTDQPTTTDQPTKFVVFPYGDDSEYTILATDVEVDDQECLWLYNGNETVAIFAAGSWRAVAIASACESHGKQPIVMPTMTD